MQQVTINQTDIEEKADKETKRKNINRMKEEEGLKERLELTLIRLQFAVLECSLMFIHNWKLTITYYIQINLLVKMYNVMS